MASNAAEKLNQINKGEVIGGRRSTIETESKSSNGSKYLKLGETSESIYDPSIATITSKGKKLFEKTTSSELRLTTANLDVLSLELTYDEVTEAIKKSIPETEKVIFKSGKDLMVVLDQDLILAKQKTFECILDNSRNGVQNKISQEVLDKYPTLVAYGADICVPLNNSMLALHIFKYLLNTDICYQESTISKISKKVAASIKLTEKEVYVLFDFADVPSDHTPVELVVNSKSITMAQASYKTEEFEARVNKCIKDQAARVKMYQLADLLVSNSSVFKSGTTSYNKMVPRPDIDMIPVVELLAEKYTTSVAGDDLTKSLNMRNVINHHNIMRIIGDLAPVSTFSKGSEKYIYVTVESLRVAQLAFLGFITKEFRTSYSVENGVVAVLIQSN